MLALIGVLLTTTLACAEFQLVKPGPRGLTEPSRDIAAEVFRSPICLKWDDGCSECSRDNVAAEPSCRSLTDSASCQRAPVSCTSMDDSAAERVCLAFHDGCNQCNMQGACTALLCRRNRKTQYYCTLFRQDFYAADSNSEENSGLSLELIGTWRLSDASGRSCDLSYERTHYYPLYYSCASIAGGILRDFIGFGAKGQNFLVQSRRDDETLFVFPVGSDFERLESSKPAPGYTLQRLSVIPTRLQDDEGKWQVGMRGDPSTCSIFLGFDIVRTGARSDGPWGADQTEWIVPQRLGRQSDCDWPLRLDEKDSEGRLIETKFPLWTSWDLTTTELTLRDELGRATVFKRQGTGFAGSMARPNLPPVDLVIGR